jgi:HEAT repeat protein
MTGCVGGWETVTSHRFRDGMLEHPWETTKSLWVLEDPVLVLLTDPPREGDERASALSRLKEPILNKGTQEDQDKIINVLAKTSATDPSPVLRMEAIGALGRFEDPRVVGILIAAYQNAHGRRGVQSPPPPLQSSSQVVTAGLSAGRAPTTLSSRVADLNNMTYQGFQPEWVTAIRCRVAESLGKTGRPEAVRFLAPIAGGAGQDTAPEGSEDRDIRLAAVRGLGHCRQPEAVVALAQVLTQATSMSVNLQDTAIIGRTHEGLVWLTGKKLPPDAQQWNEVVQAGVVIAPEPTWVQNTIVQISGWVK